MVPPTRIVDARVASLAEHALKVGRQVGGRPRGIKVSTSNYVPKPMTPFQWIGQMSEHS